MAPKKKPGKALVKWDEEFANLAKETAHGATAGEGKFLSFRGGNLTFAGANIPDNELRCVIVGWMYHNAYYDPDVRYDPTNPQSPICYAFSTSPSDKEMEPLDSVPDKQCNDCPSCPLNQYESSNTGKGRACKNTVRVALIAESELDDLANAEIVFASIPPTSLKNWNKFVVDTRDKIKRPLWSLITKISCESDTTSQFKVLVSVADEIDSDYDFGALKEMWEETMEDKVDFAYPERAAPAKPVKKVKKVAPKASKFAKR